MKNISTFEEFETVVIKAAKGDGHWVVAQGGVLGGVINPVIGAFFDFAMSPSINLNTEMYLNYLEKEYKERFEKNKHDSQYIQSLIKEAINKIQTLK